MASATQSPTYSTDETPLKVNEDGTEGEYAEFTSETDMSDEDRFALVTKLDKMFQYALQHPTWKRGRDNMVKCFKYREGEQWTPEEVAELQERHQPDTVNNQIAVVVNKLVGDVVDQPVRIGYRGKSSKLDENEANLLSDIFLYIRQSNDLEFEERDMADDGFTAGMGVLDVEVTFDDLMQPFIKVRHEDPLIVFPDPDSRHYDWNEDAKFVCRANWWKLDDAIDAYPQAELKLAQALGASLATGDDSGSGQLAEVDQFKGDVYVDKNNQRIRIIEVQYKRYEREQLAIFSDGTSFTFSEKKEVLPKLKEAKAKGVDWQIIDRLNYNICVGVYGGGILLEHKETDHKYFSLVPYFAYRRKSGEPYSLITLALSMQDAINKRESKALHLLTMNQVVAEKSAVDNKDDTQKEVAKPDGYIELRDGALKDGRFQIEKNLELAQSQYAMHQHAQADLWQIVGLDPRMGQQTGEIRSGSGLQKKYQEASKPVATLFDNLRRTRKILARVLLDRVQKYYTPGLTMLITEGQDGDGREVGITAPMMDRIKIGNYDVVVDELEDTETAQQEQVQQILNILPQIIPFGPYWVQKILSLTTIRQKDEIINDLKQQSGPPPVQPRLAIQANLDALEPEERAGVWQMAGKNDIAAAVLHKNPLPSAAQKSATSIATEQIKHQHNPQEAAAEQAQQQQEMQQMQMQHQQEMQQMMAEHELKMREMHAKHQVEIQKHHMNMQKQVLSAALQSKSKQEGARE